ncbi:hypothetical protein [Streptomyces luteolus]|uniref:Peroxisomal multifunctional enzyme type 2-like N-terminal domain-containing protein n=1 Tax=Streptomyces luteolus TaxID=3043615 RepID=A0ABT6T2U8_9ACTN|nr:hypothetical protein [Streptomyces sp. B-S-A12]MDI3422197.1 hypothetical protein [Streptomyces sp. B-S-A12]
MSVSPWRGHDLGTRTVAYTERDAILYALAVGARASDLDLVYEEHLRVLPTFGLTLAQWAPMPWVNSGPSTSPRPCTAPNACWYAARCRPPVSSRRTPG